jgi:hypothetical protein
MKNLLKLMGIKPEQILEKFIESLKNLNENDAKQLAIYVGNICIRDRDACRKIYFLSLVVSNTCKNILHGVEGGGKEGEE